MLQTADQFPIPEGYQLLPDELSSVNCSRAIELSNEGHTARISPSFEELGDVKTVLGTVPMEKHPDLAPQFSRYISLFTVNNAASTCLCVGIQQEGGDLEKDSFNFRYGFQLNCVNGSVFRLAQPKEYTTAKFEKNCVVGVALDMHDGALSFTLDGRNLGVASKDKRLQRGKYYAAILLLGAADQVTLVHQRKVHQASMGYELLFERLGIHPHENAKLLVLFEQISEHFGEQKQTKSLQKVLVESYLTNPSAFDGLCNQLKALKAPPQESKPLRKPKSTPAPQTDQRPLTTSSMLSTLIQSAMTPPLPPFQALKNDEILSAFTRWHNLQLAKLIELYFMLKYYVSLQWREAAEVEAENEKQLQKAIAQSMETAPQAEVADAGDAAAAESEKDKESQKDKESEKEEEKPEPQPERARPPVQQRTTEAAKEPEPAADGILKMFGGWRTKLAEQTTAPFRLDEVAKEAKVEVKPKQPAPPRVTVIDAADSEQTGQEDAESFKTAAKNDETEKANKTEAEQIEEPGPEVAREEPAPVFGDPEIHVVRITHVSQQILEALDQYPQVAQNAKSNLIAKDGSQSQYKLTLLDFFEKIQKMPAGEFDRICAGRIERQSEESCFEIVQVLFEGVKIALSTRSSKEESRNDDAEDKFHKFEQMLE